MRVSMSPYRNVQLQSLRAPVAGLIIAVFFLCYCSLRATPAQAIPYQDLLGTIQSAEINSAEFPSVRWRRSSAVALLTYCNSAFTQIPHNALSVGITEDGAADISDMRIEFARWRLETIFSSCAALTKTILDAQSVQQEISAWIKLSRLLEDDRTALRLTVSAGLLRPSRDGEYEDNIFGIANWRPVRVFIFEAIFRLLAKS
jgi:hypothetical protein